jgi:hypothetical protein
MKEGEGATVCRSFEEALIIANSESGIGEIHVIGGE